MNYQAKSNSTKKSIEKKIDNITRRLDTLELNYKRETTILKEELEQVREEINYVSDEEYISALEDEPEPVKAVLVKETPEPQKLEKVKKGDYVRITNHYKGKHGYQYGTVGKVTKIRGYWVYFTDKLGRDHQQSRSNVNKVKKPNDF